MSYKALPINFNAQRDMDLEFVKFQESLQKHNAAVTNYETRRTRCGEGALSFHIFQITHPVEVKDELRRAIGNFFIPNPSYLALRKLDFHQMLPDTLSCLLTIIE